MGLDLVKHNTGGADIQNKRGIFAGGGGGGVGIMQKCLYSSWNLSSSGGQRASSLL